MLYLVKEIDMKILVDCDNCEISTTEIMCVNSSRVATYNDEDEIDSRVACLYATAIDNKVDKVFTANNEISHKLHELGITAVRII